MLQIDHVYEFLYQEIFKDFQFFYIQSGVPKVSEVNIHDISIFTPNSTPVRKIFLFDQEPLLPSIFQPYLNIYSNEVFTSVFATSEKSVVLDNLCKENNFYSFYYFFHGFAALDWYRGFYSLNFNKNAVKEYLYDFISYNRIISDDRSYRIYFVAKLKEYNLLNSGLVSFGVSTNLQEAIWQDEINNNNTKLSIHARSFIEQNLKDVTKLIIDQPYISGSASADIPRSLPGWFYPSKQPPTVDAFWHIVTETVFYYDKLHLTEKIFKPIVSKQPFMLLASPGNLAYLKSYGFKTFDGIIDESYDLIEDNDQRVEAVVRQLAWYCSLSAEEKRAVIAAVAPIVEYNFHHFYGEFKHTITRELLDNTKTLFKEIGYDDSNVAYDDIYRVLTN